MSISALGVGSGLDLESLVTTLVSAQRDAKNQIYTKRASELGVEFSAIGEVKSSLEAFNKAVESLNDSTLFTGRTANITQPTSDSGDLVSVSTDSTAASGNYDIKVSQFAQGSRSSTTAGLFTSTSDVVSATGGDMTFTAGANSFSITVAAGTTLAELREQINSEATNFGVTANLIDTGSNDVRLVLNSDEMGVGNNLVVTNTDASLDNVSSVATGVGPAGLSIASGDEAKSGILEIDGISVTSTTNVFENAISGLSITALRESVGTETAKANITHDTESVQKSIESFISSYNSLVSVFDKHTKIGGALNGSSLIRGIESTMVNNLLSSFSGAGNFETVFDLGVSIDDNGKLSLNTSELSDAMTSGFDDIATMFVGDTGLAGIFENQFADYVGSTGLLKDFQDSVQESIDSNTESKEAFEYRMDQYEETLRAQFTALDAALARMNSQGDYVTAALASLPSNSK